MIKNTENSGASPIWHPFTQHGLFPESVAIERAEGAHLYTKDGQKIIDGIASWWVNTHGHCHPKIVEAVQAQAAKLDQVIFAGFTHDLSEQLAKKLLSMTDPALKHVFFSDSGSTSIEVGLKMVAGYWAHTLTEKTGKKRAKLVALEHGYHGDTIGTMSVGGRSVFNKVYDDYLYDVMHLPFPERGHEQHTVDAFAKILKEHPDEIAALVLEPLVLGAGGMKMYSASTLKALADLCKQHDVLLVADEVMTGFGRTGTFFACEQAGVTPDIVCLAKGLTGGYLPMGVTLCTEEIFMAFYSDDRSKAFYHSSSFTANAICCAAGLASLQIWEDEPVMERIQSITSYHEKALKRFEGRNDVTNIRQLGTIAAMDIAIGEEGYLSDIGPQMQRFFLERGLLLRPLGNTVYVLPPYCIETEDLDALYDGIIEALDFVGDGEKKRAA